MAHVLASRQNPFFNSLPVDCGAYDRWAQRIAAGEWLGQGVFYQDPLYPYFLGVFYHLFGRHLTALLLVQSLLGALNVVLLWGIACRLWNTRVGGLTAVLAALYAPFWFYDGLVLKTFLEVLLLNGGLLAWVAASAAGDRRNGLRRGLLAGILLGFGSLARANYLGLVPLLLLWLAWLAPRHSGGPPAPGAQRRYETTGSPFSSPTRAAGLGLLCGLFLVLVPVLVRNRVAGGDWVLTTAQAGQNFYIGNNPENHRGTYLPPSFLRPAPQHEEEDFLREGERRTGTKLSPSAASRYWLGQGLAFIASHPGSALALDLKKLGLFLHRYEKPDNEDIAFWGRYSPWLRYNFLRFGVVGPLALVGLVLGWPRRRQLSLLYMVLAGYALSICLFFILARYRLPAVSLLLIFAAGAVVETAEAVRARNRGRLLVAVVALVPALIVVHHPSTEESGSMTAEMYTNLGSAYLDEGRLVEALAAQQQAVQLSPQSPDVHYNLGVTLYRSGKRDEAIEQFRTVVRLYPDYAEAWGTMGLLLGEGDRLEEAEQALRKALALQPAEPARMFNLARITVQLHRKEETEALLQKIYQAKEPELSVEARLIEARLLADTGDTPAVAKIYREYLALRPDSPLRPQLEASLAQMESK